MVEVGLSRLRTRTVKAVIEHVCQCVLATNGTYCEPLVLDYLKALAVLLSYRAHVEHLSEEAWQGAVDFCVECVRDLAVSKEGTSSEANSHHGSLSWRGGRNFSRHSSPTDALSSFQQVNGSQAAAFPKLQSSSEDILLCLKWLVLTPKSAVLNRAEAILDSVLQLLRNYPHPMNIQQSSYNIVEQILSCTLTSDIELSLQTLRALVPVIRKYWQRISQSQRDAALAIFVRCEALLSRLYERDSNEEDIQHPQRLLQVIQEQYCARKLRDQLNIDNIILFDWGADQAHSGRPSRTRASTILQESAETEEPWNVLRLSAIIHTALEQHFITHGRPEVNEDDSSPVAKRRKQPSPIGDLILSLKHQQTATRIYALQVISFIIELYPFSAQILQSLLDTFISLLSNEDINVVNWTLYSLSR